MNHVTAIEVFLYLNNSENCGNETSHRSHGSVFGWVLSQSITFFNKCLSHRWQPKGFFFKMGVHMSSETIFLGKGFSARRANKRRFLRSWWRGFRFLLQNKTFLDRHFFFNSEGFIRYWGWNHRLVTRHFKFNVGSLIKKVTHLIRWQLNTKQWHCLANALFIES